MTSCDAGCSSPVPAYHLDRPAVRHDCGKRVELAMLCEHLLSEPDQWIEQSAHLGSRLGSVLVAHGRTLPVNTKDHVPQDSIWSSTASAGELGVASHWAEDGRPPWDGRGPGLVLGARRTHNASAVIESESQLPRDRGRLRHAAMKDVKNRSGAHRICFDVDPMHDSRGVNELQLTVCVYVRGWTASRPEIEDEPQ
jgi:hypothetical protein